MFTPLFSKGHHSSAAITEGAAFYQGNMVCALYSVTDS